MFHGPKQALIEAKHPEGPTPNWDSGAPTHARPFVARLDLYIRLFLVYRHKPRFEVVA